MNSQNKCVSPRTFFVLTFILSWLIWIPHVLIRWGFISVQLSPTAGMLLSFLGVLMPAISAFILTARVGQAGSLLSRLLLWRVNWKWWLAALGQTVLIFVTYLAYRIIFGSPPVAFIAQSSTSGLLVNIVFLLLATLGEEIGWRGLALPTLERRFNALTSSLILGVVYVTWHTLYWLAIGTVQQFGWFYMLLNYLFVFPMTLYVTWFYNRGRFSILPVTSNLLAFEIFIAFEWIAALLLIPVLKSEPPRLEI